MCLCHLHLYRLKKIQAKKKIIKEKAELAAKQREAARKQTDGGGRRDGECVCRYFNGMVVFGVSLVLLHVNA